MDVVQSYFLIDVACERLFVSLSGDYSSNTRPRIQCEESKLSFDDVNEFNLT